MEFVLLQLSVIALVLCTSVESLALFSLMQPRVQLAIITTRARCWLLFSFFCPPGPHILFLAKLLSSRSVASLYCCPGYSVSGADFTFVLAEFQKISFRLVFQVAEDHLNGCLILQQWPTASIQCCAQTCWGTLLLCHPGCWWRLALVLSLEECHLLMTIKCLVVDRYYPLSFIAQPWAFYSKVVVHPFRQYHPSLAYMGDNVKGHGKTKVSDIHCFPHLVHPARHSSTDDNHVARVQFVCSRSMLAVPSYLLVSAHGFCVDLLHNIPRKHVLISYVRHLQLC